MKRLWVKEQWKKRDELKLSSKKDFLNFLRMYKGIYEELFNLVGPRIQQQDPNQRLSIIIRILATGNSFSETCVMETCKEINKILKYNINAIKT